MTLHLKKLFLCERILCHLNEVRDDWWEKLEVLACDEHCRDAQELELGYWYSCTSQEPVNEVYCLLDCFREQSEFYLYNDEPVNQDLSVIRLDVHLVVKDGTFAQWLSLRLEKSLMIGELIVLSGVICVALDSKVEYYDFIGFILLQWNAIARFISAAGPTGQITVVLNF